MLRIATINAGGHASSDPPEFENLVKELQKERFDILCCQDVFVGDDGTTNFAVQLADPLGMTCSFAGSPRKKREGKLKHGQNSLGKAILAGSDCCMLSSGVIALPDLWRKKSVAQFAVIRKDGDAVLVVNLQLPSIKKGADIQREQVQVILDHQIMTKQYAAIILCGDLGQGKQGNALGYIQKKSQYRVRDSQVALVKAGQKSGAGRKSLKNNPFKEQVWILEEKCDPVAKILCSNGRRLQPPTRDQAATVPLHGAALDIELVRIPSKDKSQIYRYVSFIRPWTGPSESEQGASFQPAWIGHNCGSGVAVISGF